MSARERHRLRRPSTIWSAVVVALVVLSLSDSADAKRRRRAAPAGPLKVVVIPFEADGALAYEAPQQLELELELNESVTVVASARTWAELKKQGAKKFDRKRLQKVMQRRGVDVLVRGVKGFDDEGGPALHVLLYADDGRVRFQGTVSEPLDDTAVVVETTASLLEEPLSRFRTLAAIEPVFPTGQAAKKRAQAREEPAPDDSALFVDLDGDDKKRRGDDAPASPKKPPRRALVDDDPDDAEEDAPSPRAKTRRALVDDDDDAPPDDAPRARARVASEDDDASARRTDRAPPDASPDDEDRPKRRGTRARFLDEDEAERARPARERRASMADVVDDEKRAPEDKDLSHIFSVAVGGGAASWLHDFTGNKPAQSNRVLAPVFAGGTMRLDLWPIEWVGVDVDAHFQGVRFSVDDPNAPITPQQFFAWRYSASAAAKGRYILHLGKFGVGAGGRVGYRLLGVFTEKQTHAEDGDLFTKVPGYMFHTLFVGAELYAAVIFLDRRLELEVRLDGLPLTRYEEFPDNPGANSLAFGWATTSTLRMEIFYGAFAELYVFHSGATVAFDGVGNRRGDLIDATTGRRELIEGGTVLNLDGTAGLSVGFMW